MVGKVWKMKRKKHYESLIIDCYQANIKVSIFILHIFWIFYLLLGPIFGALKILEIFFGI